MKKLLIAVAVITFGLNAQPIVLTTQDGQYKSEEIDTDLLKSHQLRRVLDEDDKEVPLNFDKKLIQSVIKHAKNGYIRTKGQSAREALDLITIANYLEIRPLLSTSIASFLGNNHSSKLWSTEKLKPLEAKILKQPLNELFLKDTYATGLDEIEIDTTSLHKYSLLDKAKELPNVSNIYRAPDSSYYWSKCNKGTVPAQKYDRHGHAVGQPIANVANIYIAPDSSYYWIQSNNGTVQKYDRHGQAVGQPIANVLGTTTIDQLLFIKSLKKDPQISASEKIKVFTSLPWTVKAKLIQSGFQVIDTSLTPMQVIEIHAKRKTSSSQAEPVESRSPKQWFGDASKTHPEPLKGYKKLRKGKVKKLHADTLNMFRQTQENREACSSQGNTSTEQEPVSKKARSIRDVSISKDW